MRTPNENQPLFFSNAPIKKNPRLAGRGSLKTSLDPAEISSFKSSVRRRFVEKSLLLLGMGSDCFQNPFFLGELSGLQLGIDEVPVDGYLEATATRRNQLQFANFLLVSRQKLARQTDGLRLIVSNRTILELQMHGDLPSRFQLIC
jgi:hypothetical protein